MRFVFQLSLSKRPHNSNLKCNVSDYISTDIMRAWGGRGRRGMLWVEMRTLLRVPPSPRFAFSLVPTVSPRLSQENNRNKLKSPNAKPTFAEQMLMKVGNTF
jgi:hypothetical protein